MLGNYVTIDWFNNFDSAMFLSIIKNKISFFTLVRLFNIFTAVYFVTMIFFIRSYIPASGLSKKATSLKYALVLTSVAAYVVFYDPSITYRFYCLIQEGRFPFFWLQTADLIFYVLIITAIVSPVIFLMTKHRILLTTYKKRQIFGVCSFIILSDILWVILHKLSGLRHLYLTQSVADIISPHPYTINYNSNYTFIMLLLIGCMFYITINFNIIRQEGLISRLILYRQTRAMNKNFYKTFHSIKNVIFSYKLLLNRAQQATGDEHDNLLCELDTKIENYLNHLSLMLSSDNTLGDFTEEIVYVSDFLDETIDRLDLPKNISLIKDYEHHKEEISADTFYLSDAILNIFHNAAQAIEMSSNESGIITVSVSCEFEWTVIAITDDGVGMSRKTQKSIFNPFFTTKSRINNWGIGLSFTSTIIKYHKGKISFKSKKNHGTTFYILLPRKTI